MTVPPAATSMSLAAPSAGLAVMPELPSDPPQLVPRINSDKRHALAPRVVDPRQHLGHQLAGGFDRLARAAHVLHAEHGRTPRVAGARAADLHQLLIVEQVTERGRFAAQADQHIAADIRMPGHAAHHAIERGVPLAAELHSAAAAVREGHHAIDVGIGLERLGIESGRDILADRGRAIHRRDHGDVVARAGSAVRALVALEGSSHERRRLGRHFRGRRIVAIELPGREIVRVNPLALGNVFGGKADDLPIFNGALAFGDRRERSCALA